MSRRAPGFLAGLISLIVVLLCLIALLVCRIFFPVSFNRVIANLLAHAEAIEGGEMDNFTMADGESFMEKEISRTYDHTELTSAVEKMDAAVVRINEAGMQEVFEAEGAYIMDEFGNVIFAKNEHEQLYPASMTKMLTAIVVSEKIEDWDEVYTIPELEGCYEWGSVLLYIDPGDRMSINDLMHAMLMHSYNDCATALAMIVGGSLEGFAEMMNETAKAIGCVDSHFSTPHGLFAEDHYSSPYDMAQIVKKAVSIDRIADIMTKESYTATYYGGESGDTYTVELSTGSYFLAGIYDVPGLTFIGGKTGYIMKARSCVSTAFRGEGHTYYCCVMKALDASYMTTFLLDYTLKPYSLPALIKTEPVLKEWQVDYEWGVYYGLDEGAEESYEGEE